MIFGLCIRNKFLLLHSQWRDYGRDELCDNTVSVVYPTTSSNKEEKGVDEVQTSGIHVMKAGAEKH